MATPTKYTLKQQQAIIRRNSRQATHALVAFVGRYQEQIEALAMSRMSHIGFERYADESFLKTNEALWIETMEYMADAVVKRCIRLARDKGEL